MDFITKIFKTVEPKTNTLSLENQDPLPPYEPGGYELSSEKTNKFNEQVNVTKKFLLDVSETVINDRNTKIRNEIYQIIKDGILKNKKIRYTISIIHSDKVTNTNGYEIHTFEDNLKLAHFLDRGYCKGILIFVIVQNITMRERLAKYLSDLDFVRPYLYLHDLYESANFNYTRLLIKNESIATKYNIQKNDNDTFAIIYKYQLLSTNNNVELLDLYNESIQSIQAVKIELANKLIETAQSGQNVYKYISNDAEFYYEYFKHYNIFKDIDLSIKDNILYFSWKP